MKLKILLFIAGVAMVGGSITVLVIQTNARKVKLQPTPKNQLPTAISNYSGVVPPHAEAPAYFAVTGTPNGGRNDIAIKNDFFVILDAHTIGSALPITPVPVESVAPKFPGRRQ